MSNRAAKYEQLYKSLKKHYKPLPEPGERTVLEHLIYACCLEDAKAEQADEAFAKLQQAYFDWNEVRVTTAIELSEALSSLPNATQAGHRIKRCLQSLFEARYQYDIDDMKKANLGKATEEMAVWKGVTPFVLNYVSQNSLGGHSIPVDGMGLEVLCQCEIITVAEAEKKSVPGVERAIPKNKGYEFGSLLHQFAVEFHQSPKSPTVVAMLKEMGVTAKPKMTDKPPPAPKAAKTAPAPVETSGTKTKSPTAETSKTAKSDAAGTKKPEPVTDSKSKETGKAKEVAAKLPAKVETKTAIKPEAPSKTDSKKKPEVTDAKKVEGKKGDVKKSTAKPVSKKSPGDKASPDKVPTKKPLAKPKKPAKPEVAKNKPAPTKKATGITKSSAKQATNVKITKKKPR